MFEDLRLALRELENSVQFSSTRAQLLRDLRGLNFLDFSRILWSMPSNDFPKVSSLLPSMPTVEVQAQWTGASGLELLQPSADFVRNVVSTFHELCEGSLGEQRILDFGCGWGRLARLFCYFVNESDLYGVDPWDRSIELCKQHGLEENFYLSDYLPTVLPTGDIKFGLIYGFSVFTHLSQRAAIAALNLMTHHLTEGGLIVITVRPIDYWDIDEGAKREEAVNRLKDLHRSTGFAFLPHNRGPIAGEVTYGDTSMTVSWLSESFPDLEIVRTDSSLSDPHQTYVYMKRKTTNFPLKV
jgi:SAM-dependent methyltransferase